MSKTFTAQDLYDWREATAAISGTDLHDLFRALFDGEPSPSGREPVALASLMELARHPETEVGDSAAEFLASLAR